MRNPGDSPESPASGDGPRRKPGVDLSPAWLGERSTADLDEQTEPATADGRHATISLAEPAEHDGWRPPIQEIPRDEWYPRELQGDRVRWEQAPARSPRPLKPPRRLAVALPLMVLLGLIAAFFSWVSAEPAWLAIGHAHQGTLTVTQCSGGGITLRCVGDFTAVSGDFTAARVTVLGGEPSGPRTAAGNVASARMVSPDSHWAYVGTDTTGPLLRGLAGLIIVLLCGLGVAVASGALRLPTRNERLAAFATSLAAPFLIAIGFLAATF